jgi:hypothetical protein
VRPQRALTVPLNDWNRLFVVVDAVWALVAPFLLVAENNEPQSMTDEELRQYVDGNKE